MIRAPISSINLENGETSSSDDSVADFGSCAHHSLVAVLGEEGGETAAATISFGGGILSFSFVQSYAR